MQTGQTLACNLNGIDTTFRVQKRVGKVRKVLESIGLEPERLQVFALGETDESPVGELDGFIERISALRLTSVINGEVKS